VEGIRRHYEGFGAKLPLSLKDEASALESRLKQRLSH
jgi:hypothetical protein